MILGSKAPALGTLLPPSQSLILAWPQLRGLIAALLFLVALTDVFFQGQEIRA